MAQLQVSRSFPAAYRDVATRLNVSTDTSVRSIMDQDLEGASQWTRVWIPVGAGLFIVALIGSAIVVPPLRLLHFLQALIYVAVIVLARRNNAGAFGAGTTIATAWNTLQIFITHLMQAGLREFGVPAHRPCAPA